MVRRTKEEAQETRHRLLDAAEVLFQAQGVSQTSLQQIADQAGATRGAIYWHFKDKAALFNAMMERVKLPLEAAVAEAARGADVDSVDAVEAQMVEALKIMTSDLQVRTVFEIATHKVEYTQEMESVQQRHMNSRSACLVDFEKAMRATASRSGIELPIPVSVAAQGLHGLITGLIQNWLLDPGSFDLVRTGRASIRTYLAGLGFALEMSGAADRT
jgi:TetR/AcrR family transcriptional regulator, acrAB operon repressor